MRKWPFPGDSALARARRVALAYRAQLRARDTDACDQLDATMKDYGETWAAPAPARAYADDDWLTPDEVKDELCITLSGVRDLRARGRLPGLSTADGWRYRYADVLTVMGQKRTRSKGS